jgi:hypothetical protein
VATPKNKYSQRVTLPVLLWAILEKHAPKPHGVDRFIQSILEGYVKEKSLKAS